MTWSRTSSLGRAGEAWGDKGQPLPPWFHLAGGVATTPSGRTQTATQVLTPGNYVVFDIDTNAGAAFKVTGEAGGSELPGTDARVEAGEYFFRASGLKPGRNRLEFVNVGKEPHFMVA